MKRINIALATLSAALLLVGSSCNKLEEYNPSASTADQVFTTVEGYERLVNQCYANLPGQYYGRQDALFMFEMGTDIWHPAFNRRFGQTMNKYEALTPGQGEISSLWIRMYVLINFCNAAIDRAATAGYTDEAKRNAKVAEAHFVRAYAYWHIVEHFGNATLSTHEILTPSFTSQRSPITDFYQLMIEDLKFAKEWLPLKQAAGENGRATKGAAHGMLARMYLSYASYFKYWAKDDAKAGEYYALAKSTAEEVIAAKAEYGVELYADYNDVFKPENNKTNKEALYVVSHSFNDALNPQSGPNRCWQYYLPPYSNKMGMMYTVEMGGRDNNSLAQPTKYLLDLFDEEKDARYYGSFREVWTANNSAKLKWTTAQLILFNKDTVTTAMKDGAPFVALGDTALLYTKKVVADKKTRRYGVLDINDMFNPDRTIKKKEGNDDPLALGDEGYAGYPYLKKFYDPYLIANNSNQGELDVITMRLAEMYLIAAEAQFHISNNNADATALGYINVLRDRAAINGPGTNNATAADVENAYKAFGGGGYLDFILDERARELCGEHLRWFDLKRTKQLENRLGANKANPNMLLFEKEKHYFKPIPTTFLQGIDNATEYGQNPGY